MKYVIIYCLLETLRTITDNNKLIMISKTWQIEMSEMGFFPAHVLKYFLFLKSDRHYNIRIDNNSIFCQILLPVFTLSHNKGTPARQDQLHQQHKIYIIQTLLRYQQSSIITFTLQLCWWCRSYISAPDCSFLPNIIDFFYFSFYYSPIVIIYWKCVFYLIILQDV